MKKLLASPRTAVFTWFLTRLLIFFLPAHASDVPIYQRAALAGAVARKMPYAEFWFPYPPFALAFSYIPTLPLFSFMSYRRVFQWEMVVFDLCVLFYLFRVSRLLNFTRVQTALAVYFYAVLGLGMAHLLYDRLDLVMAFVWMAMVSECLAAQPSIIFLAVLAFIGIVTKIVPLFFLPAAFVTLERKKMLIALCTTILPTVVFLYVYNAGTGGAFWRTMSEHHIRGIQIESLWAAPFWIRHLVQPSYVVPLEVVTWSDQLVASFVPKLYLALSRYAGFVVMGVVTVWLLFRKPPQENQKKFLLFFIALLFLLVSQRVLSPQFFIWTLPGFALWLAANPRPGRIALVAALYLATFAEFCFYSALVEQKPWVHLILLTRNTLLLAVFALVPRQLAAGGWQKKVTDRVLFEPKAPKST